LISTVSLVVAFMLGGVTLTFTTHEVGAACQPFDNFGCRSCRDDSATGNRVHGVKISMDAGNYEREQAVLVAAKWCPGEVLICPAYAGPLAIMMRPIAVGVSTSRPGMFEAPFGGGYNPVRWKHRDG
jgi:hypothetical protein